MRLLPRLPVLVLSLVLALPVLVHDAEAADDPVLLVTWFRNNTGSTDFDPLGRGLADMVLTDLAAVPDLRVVERERLAELMGELDLQRSERVDPKTAQKAGRLVGATHAVTGSIQGVDPQIRLDIRLVEVATAEVLLAEQVTGRKDAFFDLEQELVRRFVLGLGRTVGEGSGATRVDQMDSALAYGRALDQADRGDLEAASKTLGKLVSEEPKFQLAQDRYSEIMKALYAARSRREGQLSDLSRQLLARTQEELRKGPVETLSYEAANRYLGYRVLAGNLVLGRLSELLIRGRGRERTIPEDKRDLVHQLMRDYATNTEVYIDEMKRWYATHPGERGNDLEGELEDDDLDLAKKAALGDAGSWDFATTSGVARDLAEWILWGIPDFYGDINFEVRPPLGELEPAWRSRGFDWLEDSLVECATEPDEDLRQQHTTQTLDFWARVLMREGRTIEAIARWQQILDRYPTHEDYAEYEQKIREALGSQP